MKIVLISAKARAGKDVTADYLKEELISMGNRVLIIHYADFLKWFLKEYRGWDGQKNVDGRKLLQYFGTDVVRKNSPNTWVEIMAWLLKGISTEYDYVLIPDTRFPNEIEVMKQEFKEECPIITIRVYRPNFDNGLTEEQKLHISETALDNYYFDLVIKNDGDLNKLKDTVADVSRWVIRR